MHIYQRANVVWTANISAEIANSSYSDLLYGFHTYSRFSPRFQTGDLTEVVYFDMLASKSRAAVCSLQTRVQQRHDVEKACASMRILRDENLLKMKSPRCM